MNHRVSKRKLNRTSSHRWATRRNLAQSLFEHGQIRTTLPKAKDFSPFAERLITLARKARRGQLSARRQIHKLMGERSIIPAEHREEYADSSDSRRLQFLRARSNRRHRTGASKGRLPFTALSITHHLIETVAARFENRPGGYTRIVKLADRRVGDQSALAVVMLVGDEEKPTGVSRAKVSARRIRTNARYAAVVKAGKSFAKSGRSAVEAKTPRDVETAAGEAESTE